METFQLYNFAYVQAMAMAPLQFYLTPSVELTLEKEDEEPWVRPARIIVREDKSDLISQIQARLEQEQDDDEPWVRPKCIRTSVFL